MANKSFLRKAGVTAALFALLFPCKLHAQKFYGGTEGAPLQRLFSFDCDCLLRGLKNSGWGFGIKYSQYLGAHIAATGRFGHSVFRIDGESVPTVSFELSAELYPFCKGIHGPYISAASSMEYLGFSGEESGTYICVKPAVGWKTGIFRWLSTDIFAGYKFTVIPEKSKIPDDRAKLFASGWNVGISFSFHFKKKKAGSFTCRRPRTA